MSILYIIYRVCRDKSNWIIRVLSLLENFCFNLIKRKNTSDKLRWMNALKIVYYDGIVFVIYFTTRHIAKCYWHRIKPYFQSRKLINHFECHYNIYSSLEHHNIWEIIKFSQNLHIFIWKRNCSHHTQLIQRRKIWNIKNLTI